MKYIGSRFETFINERKGNYSVYSEKMKKYKKSKRGATDAPYRLESLYGDGLNITLNTLTALIKETGKPITYFVDFEDHELEGDVKASLSQPGDAMAKIEHLEEILALKEEIIALKDREIESLHKELEAIRTKMGQ